MSNTYKILYRHVKMTMPEPNSETYDCWLDTRANTFSFRRLDEYGPTETMSLNDTALHERFKDGVYTIVAELPEYPEVSG
jgi:hypothetical protein